eukprot:SAG31_NODE_1728_length_7428_cov_2.495975_2_plen_193_part_00
MPKRGEASPFAFRDSISALACAEMFSPLPGLRTQGDTFSISALHLSIKVPYFCGHKSEKVTNYLRRFFGLRFGEVPAAAAPLGEAVADRGCCCCTMAASNVADSSSERLPFASCDTYDKRFVSRGWPPMVRDWLPGTAGASLRDLRISWPRPSGAGGETVCQGSAGRRRQRRRHAQGATGARPPPSLRTCQW